MNKSQVFNDIREAYEVLSDKKKRKWYDQGGMLLVSADLLQA